MSAQYYYEPFFSLSDLHRLVEDSFAGETQAAQAHRPLQDASPKNKAPFPKVDVYELKDTNLVTATFELAGLTKEDVNIEVHNNRLTISGQTLATKDTENEHHVVRERRCGKFSRSIPLPSGTLAEKVKASMDNGLLIVTFPKASPEQAAKRISIL